MCSVAVRAKEELAARHGRGRRRNFTALSKVDFVLLLFGTAFLSLNSG